MESMHFASSSAQSFIFTLQSRISDLEVLNSDISDEKMHLATRVRLLEEMVSDVFSSRSHDFLKPEFLDFQNATSVPSDLVKNINYITFCKAAADICRGSEAVDLKGTQLIRLIPSFLLHKASDMDCFFTDSVLVESSLVGQVDEIARYQAMNGALCALVEKLQFEIYAVQKTPNGWC